jgi:beta-barrel assembly-enhancing protease
VATLVLKLNSAFAVALAAALCASPAGTPPAFAQVRLPSLGDSVGDEFDIGTERRLGDQIMGELRRDPLYLDDPLLLDYLNSLWGPLVATARQRGEIGADIAATFAWQTFLVRDRTINAFALPGGYFGVFLGLISLTANRDELAAVLAHELSHATQRHIARSMASAGRQSMVGLAAMLLGILAAARTGNADMAQAAVVGGQAAVLQGQLNYSRDMEREADRVGFGVFSGAGFAPAGVASMFEKLENANRLNDAGAFPYLRSHPMNSERIGDARTRAEAAAQKGAVPSTGTQEHALMQGRSRVLMEPMTQAWRRLQAQAQEQAWAADAAPADKLSALYAGALASLMLREPNRAGAPLDAAQALLRGSVAREPRAERALILLRAQLLLAQGDARAALRLYDDLADSGSRAMVLGRAQLVLDAVRSAGTPAEELRRSTETLQTWVADRRDDALAWSLLSQSTGQLGMELRSVRADAESRMALGDLRGAVDRLHAGQRLARSGAAPDFIESSIIDARTRELDARLRRLEAELRGERVPPLR